LVDFGDAAWGDAVFDLVVLTHWHPKRIPEVLRGYAAAPRVRDRFDQTFLVYSFWRHLFVARWYCENGFSAARSRAAAARVSQELLFSLSEDGGTRDRRSNRSTG